MLAVVILLVLALLAIIYLARWLLAILRARWGGGDGEVTAPPNPFRRSQRHRQQEEAGVAEPRGLDGKKGLDPALIVLLPQAVFDMEASPLDDMEYDVEAGKAGSLTPEKGRKPGEEPVPNVAAPAYRASCQEGAGRGQEGGPAEQETGGSSSTEQEKQGQAMPARMRTKAGACFGTPATDEEGREEPGDPNPAQGPHSCRGQGRIASRECPVCLVDYRSGDIIKWLPACAHTFHASCIDAWLQHSSTCPLCRLVVEVRQAASA